MIGTGSISTFVSLFTEIYGSFTYAIWSYNFSEDTWTIGDIATSGATKISGVVTSS